MKLQPLPERYRPVVTAVGIAPLFVLAAAWIGEVFLDEYFGSHWTRHFCLIVFAGWMLVLGGAFLAFRGPAFADWAKVTEASLARMFRADVLAGCVFAADAIFEALIYPAFALHGWEPQQFVVHAAEMTCFAVMIVWVGHSTRRRLLEELREAKNETMRQ